MGGRLLIAGGGLAGASLVARLAAHPELPISVLVVDGAEPAAHRAASWAFWTDRPGILDPAISMRAAAIRVCAGGRTRSLALGRYRYCRVRGADLHDHVRRIVAGDPRFSFRRGHIDALETGESAADGVVALIDGEQVRADWALDSVFGPPDRPEPDAWLRFSGVRVRTAEPVFDPAAPTLFDFRTAQDGGASFVYVLPIDPRHALVEHTSFLSPGFRTPGHGHDPLTGGVLDRYLREVLGLGDRHAVDQARVDRAGDGQAPVDQAGDYQAGDDQPCVDQAPVDQAGVDRTGGDHGGGGYVVEGTERGLLALSTRPPARRRGAILAVGRAGGLVKAATGYAFSRIQADSAAIVDSLRRRGHPFDIPEPSTRHRLLDGALLDLVRDDPSVLERTFDLLFDGSRVERTLRFLDEQTSPAEEALLFRGLPVGPFARAFANRAASRTANNAACRASGLR